MLGMLIHYWYIFIKQPLVNFTTKRAVEKQFKVNVRDQKWIEN